ncbi:MAG: adenylate kinase [Pseudonocardiales bacterium]|jgi:adenylate kinase|nr:adenylate kinase [Pseudonocardiales bacterium]
MLGAPGSGKGTQGERLAAHLVVPHIASGDLLRAQVRAQTELGRRVAGCLDSGRLVPDELVFDLVLPVVLAAAEADGYVLDGFPRSVAQAVKLDEHAAGPERVIFLSVPQELLVRRLLERAAGSGRSDDTLTVITDRLQVFESETRPLIEHYRACGVLREVAADQPVDEVTKAILAVL